MISLGGGLPSSDYFPFHRMDVKVPALGKFSEAETETSGVTLSIGKHDVQEGKSSYGKFGMRDLWICPLAHTYPRLGYCLELRPGNWVRPVAEMDY